MTGQVLDVTLAGQVFRSDSARNNPHQFLREIQDGHRDESPGQGPKQTSEYAPVFKTGAPAHTQWAGSIPVRLRQGADISDLAVEIRATCSKP